MRGEGRVGKMHAIGRVRNGVPAKEVRQLLAPQIQFLRAAGVTLDELSQALRSEFRRRLPKDSVGRVERIKYNNQCARLIANWKVLPDFLDHTGYPRDLPLRGVGGFHHLAKISAPGVKPGDLLTLLHRFGSIAKTKSGRLRLRTKIFVCKTPAGQVVAFEPNIQFLTDAARAVEDQLNVHIGQGRFAHRYWRTVDNHWIPARYVQDYIAFSKRRGMVLMEEIEDWLDEHEATRYCDSGRNLRRLGIGFFAISDHSAYNRSSRKR
jgi:hypothetical protein